MKKIILAIGFSILTISTVVKAENKSVSGVIKFSGAIVESPCQIDHEEKNFKGNYNVSCYNPTIKEVEKKSFNIIKTKEIIRNDRYTAQSVKIKENLYRIDINYH